MGKTLQHLKATLCGNPSSNTLSLAFELVPESEERKSLKGIIFGVMELSGGSCEVNPLIGKKCLEIIEQEYFDGCETSNLTVLKSSLNKTREYLTGELTGDQVEVNISLTVLWRDIVYLAVLGFGRILLWRTGDIVPLLYNDTALPIQGASGKVIPKDILILETKSFNKIIFDEKLLGFVGHQEVLDISEMLLPLIHESENSAGAAGLFLQFGVGKEGELTESDGLNTTKVSENLTSVEVDIPIINRSTVKDELNKRIFSIKGRLHFIVNEIRNAVNALVNKLPRNSKSLYLRQRYQPELRLPRRNHNILIMAAIMFTFLVIFIAGQINSRIKSRINSELEKSLSQTQNQLEIAKSLSGLNDVLARENLISARKSLVESAVTIYGNDWEIKKDSGVNRIKLQLKNIDNQILIVSKIYTSEPSIYYDFSLLKNPVNITSLVYLEGIVYVLDGSSGSILSLELKNKSGNIKAADGDFINSRYFTVRDDNTYVYTEKGIFQVSSTNKKTLAVNGETVWPGIISLAGFGGNIYTLDKNSNQIWKYIATENGYTTARNYLNSDVKADFSSTVSMVIDGSIYLLTTLGNITKFTQGRAESYNLTGLDKEMNNPEKIYTTEISNYIYILDTGNHRIIVIDKKGQYFSQYQLNNDIKVDQFFVDEILKKIYILAGTKLYSIDLKT